jgi:hypothetical protein
VLPRSFRLTRDSVCKQPHSGNLIEIVTCMCAAASACTTLATLLLEHLSCHDMLSHEDQAALPSAALYRQTRENDWLLRAGGMK